MYYDYLNQHSKVPYPFDRHTTYLESYLGDTLYKGKEFDENDVSNFDLSLMDVEEFSKYYCDDADIIDVGTYIIESN